MRTKAALLAALLATLWLVRTAASQPLPPDSSTFILGLFHVSSARPTSLPAGSYTHSYQHYAEFKKKLHVNLLFDYYDEDWKNLATARDEGIWLTGWRNWSNQQDYHSIQSLGSNSEAGLYWTATDNPDYPCFSDSPAILTGDNFPDSLPDEGLRHVRRASREAGHEPGIMLSNFFSPLRPFLYAGGLGYRGNQYLMRIYGKITEPIKDNSIVLTVKATWKDSRGVVQTATWDKADSGVFTAQDLGDNEWKLSEPKRLWVRNSEKDRSYWGENIEITWTGAYDLEIYYITISNFWGDALVYDPAHRSDRALETAATFFNQQPALIRHFIVDDPTWSQIWANAYLDQKIGASESSCPFTLGDPVDQSDNPYLIKLWTDLMKHSPNFMTYCYPIKGNADTLLCIPNPYDHQPPRYQDYDDHLNNSSAGLNQEIKYLTGNVWKARKRFDPPKTFWFVPQMAGGFRKKEDGAWRWDIRHSTPEEFRCMSYLGVACGARGIVPYLYYTDTDNGASDWQIGVVDEEFRHDVNWDTLAGYPDQYVAYHQTYAELGALYKTLEALGPHLMQMQYVDSGYTAPLTKFIPDHGIREKGVPVAENHMFLSSFKHSAAETDSEVLYFALVNRDCWPAKYKGHNGAHKYDIHLVPELSGRWILRDLATGHRYKSKGTPPVFKKVPFDPGLGRVFKLVREGGR